MDIGLDGPEDAEALARILLICEDLERLWDRFGDEPDRLTSDNCELAELAHALPDPPVDIRLSVNAGLRASYGCLTQIAAFITDRIPTTPIVLSTLARTALLSAARVVMLLGPASREKRHEYGLKVLQQDGNSLGRFYDVVERFEYLTALVPPEDVLIPQRARIKGVLQGGSPPGEAAMLKLMASVVAEQLSEVLPDSEGQIREHALWVFNIHSGMAHGYGWPGLVPRTESLPGHFISDLFLIASTVQLAFDVAWRHTEPTSSVE